MEKENNVGEENQGFSVDFGLEDEHISVDMKHVSEKDDQTKPSTEVDTSSNFSELSTSSSTLEQPMQHDSFQLPPETFTDNRQTPSSGLTSTQIIHSEGNAQSRMNGASESSTKPGSHLVLNGNPAHHPQEIRKTSLQENGFTHSLITPEAYFRDVRLSLDVSKKPGYAGVTFGSSKSYCVRCSFDASTISSSTSDTACDSCKGQIKRYYQSFLKYVVEHPLFCFCVWAMFYIFWDDVALPGGSLFALTVLEITALCLGYVAELLQFPGFLGMIASGLILRNVPYIDVAKDLSSSLSSPLRGISVVILLIRGALAVNTANIAKFKNIIIPLVIGSCVLEAVAGSVAVYLIIGFPIEWASLMGCIMSAMSGAAVLPYLASTEKFLSLKADPSTLSTNYQNVISIARTACGMDAMIAICMAEVALGFIFAEGDAGKGLVKGAVEVVMGGVLGIIWGCLAGALIDDSSSNEKRVLAVFACGVMSLIGLTKVGYPRGGPLAVFAGTLITATIWRNKRVGGGSTEQLSASFTLIWYVFQPLLFAIIGARTDFQLVDWKIVTKGLICLAISMIVRTITSFLMTGWGKFSFRERIYFCVAWLPKGTVQAALGPVALDTTLSLKGLSSAAEYEDLGYKVMNISAAYVIVAATVGTLCLRLIGPRLLSQK